MEPSLALSPAPSGKGSLGSQIKLAVDGDKQGREWTGLCWALGTCRVGQVQMEPSTHLPEI